MKYLKKFELFDTEDLKLDNELNYLSGKIPVKKIVNIKSPNDFEKFFSKLVYKFPFFGLPEDKYYYIVEEPKEVFHFIFKNEDWLLYLSIHKKEELYDIGIGYMGVNLKVTKNSDIIIINDRRYLDEKSTNKSVIEIYENKNWNQVEQIIEKSFIPTMKELRFDAMLHMTSVYDIVKN